MSLFLLDTDTVTLLRAQHPDVLRRFRATQPGEVAVSVITVEEALSGWYNAVRRAVRPDQLEFAYAELAATVHFFAGVPIINFTRPAIVRYESLLRAKLNVRKNDLRIAAIALEAGAVVVTRNVRDFARVPQLAAEDWSQPTP